MSPSREDYSMMKVVRNRKDRTWKSKRKTYKKHS
jgi:hypothetical protein